MTDAIADTSVFIARESGRQIRSEAVPDRIAVSVITLAELRSGVLMAGDAEARHLRLETLMSALALEPISVDQSVAEAWARLRAALSAAGRRMPANDSWIAATALSLGVPVVTQDDDYGEVAGLVVIRV